MVRQETPSGSSNMVEADGHCGKSEPKFAQQPAHPREEKSPSRPLARVAVGEGNPDIRPAAFGTSGFPV